MEQLRKQLKDLERTVNEKITSTGSIVTDPVTADFRRQFPQYGSSSSNKTKKKNNQYFFHPKTTWTALFYLLPCRHTHIPSSQDQQQHIIAGLGRKKITFKDKDGDHEYLLTVLEDEYPKLVACKSAFLLYKCHSGGSGCRPIQKIPMGPVGYSIPWLRDTCRLGSICIYINPLQHSLSLEPVRHTLVSLAVTTLIEWSILFYRIQ